VTLSKTDKNTIITLTDKFKNVVEDKLLNKPIDITLNLPMIKEPKPYIMD
jgi:hypothetical protein